ncbi:MAG: electron transport complex subunit RsxC [Defluviitaleaceae bacterium]|nr:electron transport complex subunit RsxC [Defluviitaleaceae bacterium]
MRKYLSFKRGGVRLPGFKEKTVNKPIIEVIPDISEQMRYPLHSRTRAALTPLVNTGDIVHVGQKIADSDDAFAVPIHASVSGVVLGFSDTVLPDGVEDVVFVIENDGLFTESPDILPRGTTAEGFFELGSGEIIGRVRDAGIVGMGGGGFPTFYKLQSALQNEGGIDYIIANGAECEPYLTCDTRLLYEEYERVITGLKTLMRLFPNSKGIIAIEADKQELFDLLEEKCAAVPGISPVQLKVKYPAGYEKNIVQSYTGRTVPPGGYATDSGCLVFNVDTLIAIERAIRRGRPLMRRVVTLAGSAVSNPGNYAVPIGLSFASLIDAAGGYACEPHKFIFGGPMMGVSLADTDIPVTKTSAGLLCLNKKDAQITKERNCIKCGKCAAACTSGLLPMLLNKHADAGDPKTVEYFEKYNGKACVNCGSCTYVCPSKRHLAQSIFRQKFI